MVGGLWRVGYGCKIVKTTVEGKILHEKIMKMIAFTSQNYLKLPLKYYLMKNKSMWYPTISYREDLGGKESSG